MAAEALAVNEPANVIRLEQKRSEPMGNPQLDEGHTRIANELLEAVLSFGFSARQLHIVLAVVRKTYGYNKKADEIGLSQFRDLTGMARSHVSKTINELVAMNVLKVEEGSHAHRIELNKKYREWVLPNREQLPIQEQLPKREQGITKSVNQVLPIREPQNTIQKTTPKDSGYTTDFLFAWEKYPKRDGDNNKTKAFKAWTARLREGVLPADLIAGVERYAAYCISRDMVGSCYVKQAATFFGPDGHWAEPWTPMVAQAPQASPMNRLSAAGRSTAEAAKRWLESQEGQQ